MSKKILLVTDSYLPTISGVTTVVSNYAMELKKQGCKVKILAPYHRDTPSSRELISIKGVTNPFRLDTVIPLSIFTIQSQVEDFAPDVVHIHSPSILGLWARNWAQQTNTRLVITVHGIPSFLAKYLPFSRYYSSALTTLGWKYWKWFLNPSDVVLAPSQFIVRELKKLKLASKIIKVPFWIEKYQLLPRISSHEKNVQFLYFGRLDQDKNLRLLIKAWSMVPQTNKFLTIAGRSLKIKKML